MALLFGAFVTKQIVSHGGCEANKQREGTSLTTPFKNMPSVMQFPSTGPHLLKILPPPKSAMGWWPTLCPWAFVRDLKFKSQHRPPPQLRVWAFSQIL